MSIPVQSWVSDQDAIRLARSFSKLTLMDFLAGEKGVSITERLEEDSGSWVRAYYVTLKFHPSERIEAAFGLTLEDIARSVASSFLPALSKLMKKQMKLASATGDVADVRGGTGGEIFDVHDDEKLGGGDKKNDTLDGDESEDDDENDDDSVDKEQHGRQMNASDEESDGESTSDNDHDSEGDSTARPATTFDEAAGESESTFLNMKSTPIVRKKQSEISLPGLRVEPDSTPLLMVGIVEEAAAVTIVRHHKGIEEAFINEERGRGRCFQTAGVNFDDVWKLEQVEHDKLDSNDIWAIRRAYGVEAARNNIVIQIRNVFGVYGIEVDPRHLSLIADYMTFDGGYKAMSRNGMQDNHSAFQQMSFETTANFLKFAALNGLTDKLVSPSASIVVGRPVKVGTGTFSLLSSM
jgi:DNA-directed RNA polymerase I subunit RPA1